MSHKLFHNVPWGVSMLASWYDVYFTPAGQSELSVWLKVLHLHKCSVVVSDSSHSCVRSMQQILNWFYFTSSGLKRPQNTMKLCFQDIWPLTNCPWMNMKRKPFHLGCSLGAVGEVANLQASCFWAAVCPLGTKRQRLSLCWNGLQFLPNTQSTSPILQKKKQIMQLSSSLSRCSINSTEECVALVDQ